MKAWRAQLAKWPKETPRAMDPASAPLEMRDPDRLKAARREGLGAILPLMVAFWGPMAIALVLMGLTFGAAGAPNVPFLLGVAVAFGGVALSFASVIGAAKLLGARSFARRRRRDLEALEARGEATLGAEYVGVSYSGERWRHPVLGDDMDHGVLRIDFDRLTFVGRNTRFELPASALVGTEIRRFDQVLTGPLPRLYVTWRDGDRTRTFSVEPSYQPSLRRRVEAIAELQARIEAWRQERRPRLGTERPFLAPPDDFRLAPSASARLGWVRPGRSAKLLAIATAFSLALATNVALMFVAIWMGIDLGPLRAGLLMAPLALWPLLAQAIERRLPERYRFRESSTLLPSVDRDAARAEEEEKTHLQA